ncbi:DNA replication and repair protein recF [uncultured Ruminococcus sp.]|uniref:DNA replication and repair protein RecF n=1 Tax=Massiliimalia timonensis TaxID=1987501 RepID=A0A8J6PFN0_9FIRM|nr:DNA replication/repair protein RecF [Massiliimalia timonensis]MBC8610892.1 DNA replication/repair protein RecF [Massiliimalia timonensis]SCI02419.1 DNA replication and repair protein recF [uncultured Clostridium sp.]SCI15768.1 DNA replication and repair protein recF [uncultured Ruminococcus sp.]
MVLKKLTLKNYRNLLSAQIEPCGNVNIIYGDNAQGKTNLIEAIWLFTGNNSFRAGKTSELIHFEQQAAELSILFEDSEREQQAKIKLGTKKEYFLNQVPLKKASEMTGNFYAVIFSPVDLSLADGSPKNRRKFLDAAISQLTPQYSGYLEQYERVLEQRNALLKDLYRFPALRDTIDIWDLQLAKLGTILSIYRNDYVKKLSKLSEKIYFGLSSESEKFSMCYRSSVFDQIETVDHYEDCHIQAYFELLQKNLEQDTKYGFTSVGIHRDDLELMIDHLPVRSYGSRGQIRSSVLALKLGEAELLKRVTGENPIMLLDDVMSELDNKRQDYILNHVKDKQVFITCCDMFNTISLQEGKVFHVENGSILSERSHGLAEEDRNVSAFRQ